MKFSAILSSLAISALQVHAIPTAADSAVITDIKLNARSPNTLGYCCVGFRNSVHNIANFIPRGISEYHWSLPGRCYMAVQRNANNCNGWKFTPTANCDELSRPYTIGVRPASDC